jgi:hypothetical protein
MNRKEQYEIHREYIRSEGLDRLIDFTANLDYKEGVFDSVGGTMTMPFPPQTADLVRIHKLIRRRKCFTALELGIGYSTVIIADALRKNEEEWNRLDPKPAIRNRHMFRLFSVDTSRSWIDDLTARFPGELLDRVHFHFSEAEAGTFRGQLCHYYRNLPDVVPDFIYLDGPSPKDVKGSVNGLSFACDERTVMSGDLLLMEPTFLPGTFILVDGRTNNARFLARNFSREYDVKWDREGDVTTFELKEERLGKYNLLGTDFLRS